MATKTIGIPRALFYYYLFPLWDVFFRELGYQVILSPPTDKRMVDLGIQRTVDEVCYPVKIYYGHVASLLDKVDYLFLPRLVSIQRKSYICPKFMGLPDMLKANFTGLPAVIDHTFDGSLREHDMRYDLEQLGLKLGHEHRKVKRACALSLAALDEYEKQLKQGQNPMTVLDSVKINCREKGFKVGLLGHGYNIYDPYASMNLIKKLGKLGVEAVTVENIDGNTVDQAAKILPKRIFWTLGHRVVGSAFHLEQREDIKGIIHVASFGCGPDSMVAELLERFLRRTGKKPLLCLTIDEHTGEAGMDTRLEAFIDMIARRKIS